MDELEKFIKEQIDFLVGQYKNGEITYHQLKELIDMAYKDYLDMNKDVKHGKSV